MARVSKAVAAAAIAAVSAGVGACGGSSSDPNTVSFAGLRAKPQLAAPSLELRDSLGKPVNIRDYQGKAVLVTFIYSHCPDVCPLIVGHLHAAQTELGGEASKLQIIAVSTDPVGDTPKAVNSFLAAHQMTGKMQYLLGSRPQLERVWKGWNIVAHSPKGPNAPDLVEHSAEVFGIDASGRITTVYPASFRPRMIVHDVPLLASE